MKMTVGDVAIATNGDGVYRDEAGTLFRCLGLSSSQKVDINLLPVGRAFSHHPSEIVEFNEVENALLNL